MNQLQLFEKPLSQVVFAWFHDSSENTRHEPLYKRANLESRGDDTVDIIQKRFQTFNETSMPVVHYLEGDGRLETIIADGDTDSAYNDVICALQKLLHDDLKRR